MVTTVKATPVTATPAKAIPVETKVTAKCKGVAKGENAFSVTKTPASVSPYTVNLRSCKKVRVDASSTETLLPSSKVTSKAIPVEIKAMAKRKGAVEVDDNCDVNSDKNPDHDNVSDANSEKDPDYDNVSDVNSDKDPDYDNVSDANNPEYDN
ncbi:hypothetical protein BGX24_008145, partial [Mortierella sp. AD032]